MLLQHVVKALLIGAEADEHGASVGARTWLLATDDMLRSPNQSNER